jgi:hypothetical protein
MRLRPLFGEFTVAVGEKIARSYPTIIIKLGQYNVLYQQNLGES